MLRTFARPAVRLTAVRLTAVRLTAVRLTAVAVALAAFSIVAGPSAANADPLADGVFPTNEVFIDQASRDVLFRPPTDLELTESARRLASGLSASGFINEQLQSAEVQTTSEPVIRLYRSLIGRRPDPDGLRFWVSQRQQGQSLARLAQRMLAENELQDRYGGDTSTEVVDAVYENMLGRSPEPEGLAYWAAEIDQGRRSLHQVLAAVSESPEHQSISEPEVMTSLVFLTLLQRLPEPEGLAYWTRQLADGLDVESLVTFVIDGTEFRARFGNEPSPTVAVVATGLSTPWDVEPIDSSVAGSGVLFTERTGAIKLLRQDGTTITLATVDNLFVNGETGVMGLALDQSDSNRFFVCHGHRAATNGVDIRVTAWRLTSDGNAPTAEVTAVRQETVVAGLPIVTGRHGGCQLESLPDGTLAIGTGDAATGTLPQNLGSLGGKVLRVDPATGAAPADNPFATSANANTRLVYSYGHRNVQGLGVRPDTGRLWSAEHGPDRDDEINQLVPGGNAGWNPVGSSYNESVPMTDHSLPNTFDAAWSSGFPTVALAGVKWIEGNDWGSFEGALAATTLKDQRLYLFFFDAEGRSLGQRTVIDQTHGRLRGITQGPDGALWVTTSSSILRVSPS